MIRGKGDRESKQQWVYERAGNSCTDWAGKGRQKRKIDKGGIIARKNIKEVFIR